MKLERWSQALSTKPHPHMVVYVLSLKNTAEEELNDKEKGSLGQSPGARRWGVKDLLTVS